MFYIYSIYIEVGLCDLHEYKCIHTYAECIHSIHM